MEKHVSVIAALQIGLGILGIITGIFVLVVLNLIGGFVGDKDANFILSLVGNIVAVFMFVLSVPGIIAGMGLLRHMEWARILTIVISVINLINFPLGTAVGIYCIWALSQEETVIIFKTAGTKESA